MLLMSEKSSRLTSPIRTLSPVSESGLVLGSWGGFWMELGSVASRVSMKQPRQVRVGWRRHSSVRADTVPGSIIVADRGRATGSGRAVFWVSPVRLQELTAGVGSDVGLGVW